MGLNVIYVQNKLPALTEEQSAMFAKVNFNNQISECREVNGVQVVQALANSIEQLEQYKTILTQLGKFVGVIGIWQENGLQYGYEEVNTGTYENPVFEIVRSKDEDGVDVVIDYPFNITEYTNYLNDVNDGYDDNQNPINPHRPTEAEARQIQVNVFGGNPHSRDLITYL